MHDRTLVSCDEPDEVDGRQPGRASSGLVSGNVTGISDSDIQTVIALCTSMITTFNSVMGMLQMQSGYRSELEGAHGARSRRRAAAFG